MKCIFNIMDRLMNYTKFQWYFIFFIWLDILKKWLLYGYYGNMNTCNLKERYCNMDLDTIYIKSESSLMSFMQLFVFWNFSCVISMKWFSSENFIPAVHLQIESCADRIMDSHTTWRLVNFAWSIYFWYLVKYTLIEREDWRTCSGFSKCIHFL